MSAKTQPVPKHRRKFLAVVDHTPECYVALRFAARRAQRTGGIVTLLYPIAPSDIQQWAGVERMMREEARAEAEGFVRKAADYVHGITGEMPEIIIGEGRAADEIRALLQDDKAISILVLASGISSEGPGPLVSAIAAPSAGAYPIPVTVVPGSLSDAEVDALT
jgi:nucleotide-binding universal stress UspA family protein